MVKYAPYTMTAAGNRARAGVGGKNLINGCLAECINPAYASPYNIPAPWGWGGNGRAWAINYWLNAVAKGKVVKTSDPMAIPFGALIFFVDNADRNRTPRGAGHVSIGAGNGYTYSTDRPSLGRWGKVSIKSIESAWAKTLVGYILISGDGYTLTDKNAVTDPSNPAAYYIGAKGDYITTLGKNLVKHGFDKHYKTGPGPVFGEADRLNVQDAQKAQGFTGKDADGYPGKSTLAFLASAPDTKPPVTPPPTDSFTMRIGNLNVNRNRITTTGNNWTSPGGFHVRDVAKGKAWSDRVKLIPKIAAQAGISQMGTQETAQYVDRDAIVKAMGSNWAGVLHGDGDLSSAIFTDKTRCKHIKDGSFKTAGPHHNQATWEILQDIETGIEYVYSVSHLIDPAQGSDTLRGQQAAAWIKNTEAIAGGRPIIFSGDMNIVATGKDPVSKAFAKYNNAEKIAKVKKNNSWGTTNQLKTKPASGRRVDQFYTSKGIIVNEIVTVFGAPATDHNLVAISVTVPK